MRSDSTDVSVAHVTTACSDLLFLIITEHGIEELVDSCPTFAFSNPQYDGTLQIVNQRGILVSLAIRYLVDPYCSQASHPVTSTDALDASMDLIRER